MRIARRPERDIHRQPQLLPGVNAIAIIHCGQQGYICGVAQFHAEPRSGGIQAHNQFGLAVSEFEPRPKCRRRHWRPAV